MILGKGFERVEWRNENDACEVSMAGNIRGGPGTYAQTDSNNTIRPDRRSNMVMDGERIFQQGRSAWASLAWSVTAIVEDNHVPVRNMRAEVCSKCFCVPCVAAETQQEGCARQSNRRRGYMDTVKVCTVFRRQYEPVSGLRQLHL